MVDIGIIGLGFIGQTVGRDIDDVDDANVAALADVDEESLRTAGETFDVPADARYESYREMFRSESLDGVLVATPHTLHYEQVRDALERDLHVLCEKPLTTDLEEARDIVDRVEDSDGTLTVGYQRRLDPAYVDARHHIAENLSRPTFVTAEITQDWINQQRGKWRADPALSGGGQLYDTGSHLVDIVLWMTDLTPVSVSAEMVFEDENDVDIQAVLNVTSQEGTVASISVSGDTPTVREHIHVWGDEGAVYVSGEDFDPRDVDTIGLPDTDAKTPWEPESKGAAFIETVLDDRPPFATAYDALVVTAVTEAAYESARTGKRVDVDL